MIAALESELVRDLDDAAAHDVLALGESVKLPAGTRLFDLGADADRLYLVERGRIALTLPMQVEGRSVDLLVEEKAGGQVVGWSAIIPPHRFTLKAEASADTVALVLPRERLLAHLAAHPAVGYRVTRNIASLVGQRLQVCQAMWLRQMQRMVDPGATEAWSGR